MTLIEALQNYGTNPAVIEDGGCYCAGMFLTMARALADQIERDGHRRLLVRSASPRIPLIALIAAQETGRELFLAHASLPDTAIDRLAELHRIGALIEDSGDLIPRVQPLRAKIEPVAAGARVYIMTSGTTGEPKVAAHSFESLSSHIASTSTSASARWLLTYPPSSFAGLQVMLTSVIGLGTLIAAQATHPDAMAVAANQYHATHISGTPSFWRAFLLALGDAPLHELRQITLGGEPVDQPLLDCLSERFPTAQIAHIYASTEAGALLTVRDRREGFPSAWFTADKAEFGLRITDGMLEVKSPRPMLGYISQHAAPVTADGWICTGDMVRVEGDRVLFTGRADVRINIGGYKVCAEEVERALLAVEGVADARVIGVPNPLTGQALVAEVLYQPGRNAGEVQKDAIRHLRSSLESYKVPRIFRAMEASALASSGKKARNA